MAKKKKRESEKVWVCPFDEYVEGADGEKAALLASAPTPYSDAWVRDEKLEEVLQALKRIGCEPALQVRSKKWRVYINAGTNIFDESDSLRAALRKAYRSWVKAGMPTAGDRRLILYVRQTRGTDEGRHLAWRLI